MYNENDLIFNLALDNMIRIGRENALKITDEEIKNCKINMFADNAAQMFMRMTRELAKCEEEERFSVIKFIEIEKPINTTGFKPRKRR